MGRFDHLATRPSRGPADIWKWRVTDALAGKNRSREGGPFAPPRRQPDRALIEGGAPQLTWIGHASFLLTLGGKRILVDPIFRHRLGPIARLAPPGIALDALPPIDVVLVSHNHRDHLDPWSLERLGRAPHFVVPLGNGDIVRSLGAEKVTELDWWQGVDLGTIEVTLVPARHWSMRYPWDRNDALWGGFVIRSNDGTAYHSGDTAFFDGFAEIGKRFGAIDWAMLPIGAYEPRWFMEPQHIGPEEAVEAARMVSARAMVAMHWGTFRLTDEPLHEPPERARSAFAKAGDAERELWILDVGETRALARR
jgi:L-ascorbate metabolism protein UlaG (beta-lactamase superfamily)